MCQQNFLPCEILLKIFQQLDFSDLFNVVMVCKEWQMVAADQSLWKKYEMVKKDRNLETRSVIIPLEIRI